MEKVECTGKGTFSLVMGIIYLMIDIYLFILTIKIVLSDDEIIYYSIIGKKRTYSWNNVRKVYYAIGGRCSQGRIIIVVDKKISLQKHMKNFLRAGKLVTTYHYNTKHQLRPSVIL